MAAIGSSNQNWLLNANLRSSTTGIPSAWGVGLSLGVPSSVSGSEITTGSGYTRVTASFAAATSGSAINATAMTYGPFSGAASITGIQVWDTVQSLNSGNILWFGTLTTARTVGVGDSLVVAAGALTISLA